VAENSELTLVPFEGAASGFAIALPKGSPLTPKVNAAIDALQKKGTLDKLKKEWLKD
jgi:polar amino acid transport system substrate-binding protein